MNLRAIALWAALISLPAAAGALAFEFYVRKQLFAWYAGNATPMMVINQSLNYWPAIDDYFKRKPSKSIADLKVNETFTVAFVVEGEVGFEARATTNNHGFLSGRRYDIARPSAACEFRIYFAGDSMTGTTTMNYQWVDLVEDILNSSPELISAVGGKTFRTYNGGVPGANFKYFWDYYQRAGKQFDPDLIVVNYIESDFPRAGKSGHEAHTDDEDLMIKLAAPYVESFLHSQPVPTIFTLMPLYQDLFPRPANYHLTERLKKAVPKMELHTMRDRLPWNGRQLEVRGWYNLPHDGHMSDEGGRHYALAMAKLIAAKISGRTDFMLATPAARSAPAERAAPKEITPSMRSSNLVQNGSFSRWSGPHVRTLDWKTPGEVAKGWHVSVDGADGEGQVEVSRVALDRTRIPAQVPDDAVVLRFRTLRPASRGTPSLQGFVPGWRQLAGRPIVASLWLRAPSDHVGQEVMLLLAAEFGSGEDITPERVLYFDKFTLESEWAHLYIPVQLPSAESKRFGSSKSERLRVQFMAAGPGKPVGFDVVDVVLALDSSTRKDRSIVAVGDRKLPAAAFAKLRAEINARFLKTRRFALKSYGFYRVTGREVPYGFLPVGVPYKSAFVPLTLAVDPPESVLLNVYCTAGEVSLENPDCYHTYQVYAR